MEINEWVLGSVTYEVRRSYDGVQTLSALVRDRLLRDGTGKSSFDEAAGRDL